MKHLLILSLLISFNGISQQDPLTSFYWNNYSFFNPAMSGVAHKHEANVTWRNQWDKVNGAPNSLFVNYGMNLAEKHGIGVNYLYETIGFSKVNQLKVNYNYQLKLDENKKLAFGTALNFQNLAMNPIWIFPDNPNDPSLPAATSTNNYGVDLGIAYYGNKLIAGIGVTQITLNQSPVTSSSGASYNTAPYAYANLRYEADFMSESKFIFETQARTDFVKYSIDINVGYNWKDILQGGIGYRTSDAINVNLTGIIAKKYRVGYAYDMTINKLSNISRGTHEITLGLRLPN
jgi:type IX secretion system PorP/SprF family membrane protein